MRPPKVLLLSLVLALPVPSLAQSVVERMARLAPQVRVSGSYLGISVNDSNNADQGVQIVHVTEETPAAKAGLKAGDILLAYNGEPILGSQQLGRLVWETPPGRHVKVQISRDGKISTIVVVTAAQPVPAHSADFGTEAWRPDVNPGMTDVPIPTIAWRNALLGLEYESLSPQLAPFFGVHEGVLIRSVDTGSAAEKGGVKPGDVLVAMGDRPVAGRKDLSGCLRQQVAPGKPLQLAVVRNHKRVSLAVQLPD